jgi:hypothetical protein
MQCHFKNKQSQMIFPYNFVVFASENALCGYQHRKIDRLFLLETCARGFDFSHLHSHSPLKSVPTSQFYHVTSLAAVCL